MNTKIVTKNFWKIDTHKDQGFCPIVHYTCPKCNYTNYFTMRFGKEEFPVYCPQCTEKNIKNYSMEYTLTEI